MEQFYKKCIKLILSLFIISMISNNIFANKIYVSLSGNNSDGSSWANAYTGLQTALGAAVDGDTIVVATGTYIPDASLRTVAFNMVAGVRVFGGFAGNEIITQEIIDGRDFETNETILSGDLVGNDGSGLIADNSYTVVIFDAWLAAMSNTTILDGFTISGGYAAGSSLESANGGGIYMQQGVSKDCNPLLRNLIVKNNRARSGGGLYMDGLLDSYAQISPTIERVVFDNNYAYYTSGCGGGIYMAAGPNATIDPVLKEVAFINNTANASGGGVFFLGGYAGEPGTVSSTLSNVTFYGNSCGSNNGSAVFIHGEDGLADPVFNNVIFYGNPESQIFKTELSGSASPSFNHCLITGSPSSDWNSSLGTNLGGNIDDDPLFADPDNSNVDVLVGSPVLNAGDNTYGLNIGYYQGTGVTKPTVTVVADFIDFGSVEVGFSSDEQTFTVSAYDLINAISIVPPTGFEVSLSSGAGFFSDLSLYPSYGGVETTTIYIRFKPDVTGDHSGNLAVNSPGASEQLFALTAYAGGSPEISTIDNQPLCSNLTLNQAFTVTDDDLSTISFDVLISNETILPPENVEITGSDGTYNLKIIPLNTGVVDLTVEVTDANLNTASTSFTLSILSIPSLSIDFINRVCNGDPAELTASATGGTGSINYKLNDGIYSLQTYFDYLQDGDYVVVALDDAGCTDTSETYTVGNPSYITGSGDVTKQITCQDDNDATISVSASGGWGGFEYSLNNVDYQTSNEFTDLSAGDYSIYVRDQGGCTENIFNTNIINPDQLAIDYITISDMDGSVNKEINIVAYGGWFPLTYALNDAAYQSESYFSNIPSGEYTAYVKDDNGCIVSDLVNVSTGIFTIEELKINVYPNPASNYLYVDSSQFLEKIEKIEIYNLSGQKQVGYKADKLSGYIDINGFTHGVYILSLKLKDGNIAYKKIIIQ